MSSNPTTLLLSDCSTISLVTTKNQKIDLVRPWGAMEQPTDLRVFIAIIDCHLLQIIPQKEKVMRLGVLAGNRRNFRPIIKQILVIDQCQISLNV